jgi:hypothetical protein
MNAVAQIAAPSAAAAAMQIFSVIPPRHGVLPVEYDSPLFRAGEVAVFDEMWTHHSLEEDGIYVVEYQRPPACMPWEDWIKPGLRGLLQITRSMVRVARHHKTPGLWMTHPLARSMRGMMLCSDGPMDEFVLTNQIVGKVVGIYNPAAIEGSAA